MENKKIKKKLTLSISGKKSHSTPNYSQSRGKTSVVIEKKAGRKWGEKKFQPRDNTFNRSKPTSNYFPKKTPINKNFDLRKIAEERATKRFKGLDQDKSQTKKGSLSKDKNFPAEDLFLLSSL